MSCTRQKKAQDSNKTGSATSLQQHLFIKQFIKTLETEILQCTRGVSERVLRATMRSSCCWSALAAWSPEDGSWLSEVVVLEELNWISLHTEERTERDCFKKQHFPSITETLPEEDRLAQRTWSLPPPYLKSSPGPQQLEPKFRCILYIHCREMDISKPCFFSSWDEYLQWITLQKCLFLTGNRGHTLSPDLGICAINTSSYLMWLPVQELFPETSVWHTLRPLILT